MQHEPAVTGDSETSAGDRKLLSAFYTEPSSAALLAELAVARVDTDWGDADKLAKLRIADLACGTGALLVAAYRRIAERHRARGGADGAAHSALVSHALIGCDVVASAVQQTATRLAGERPEGGCRRTKAWLMPYGLSPGSDTARIGALDLLNTDCVSAQRCDVGISPRDDVATLTASVPHGSLDAAIMNPPYARPTGHEGARRGTANPAFAALGQDRESQRAMGRALDQQVELLKAAARREARDADLSAVPVAWNGNAGLGTAFVDLAHAKLSEGGTLALVLPAAVASGRAWRRTRELLAGHYQNVTIVMIAERGAEGSSGRAFSADTRIAEAIVVATKLEKQFREHIAESVATYVMLDRAPASVTEAVAIARCVTETAASTCPTVLRIGESRVGWALAAPFGPGVSGQPGGVSEPGVAATAAGLTQGRLVLPRHTELPVPITRLDSLGQLGPYHSDIDGIRSDGSLRGPFDIDFLPDRRRCASASWPILWSHDHRFESTMRVLPCSYGTIRPGARPKALARALWDGMPGICGATRLHISRDARLNSGSIAACMTPVACIGGRAWPSVALASLAHEKAMCAWLNSTVGLIGRWWVSSRQQGGRVNLGVAALGSIPVIDLSRLPDDALGRLAAVFDVFEDQPMRPANEAFADDVRDALDQEVLCDALQLPESILDPLSTVRLQWCSEPSVHGGKATRPT
ncbi:hypothetical protein [Candidatus Poriferisodalis sp.]|uniref:hypothetical protein n=1 Tax=Candidatus Poriferisodalis sp. TaxID=3101277 RepID=UPI003B01736A